MADTATLERTTRINRQQLIISALAGEIDRQRQQASGGAPILAQDFAPTEIYVEGTLDLQSMAEAIERALDGLPGLSSDAPVDEGTPPQELNSSNDG